MVLAAFDMFEFILRRSMPAGTTRRRHLPPGAHPVCVFSCFCRQKKEKAPKEKRPFFFFPRIVDTNAAGPPRAAFFQNFVVANFENRRLYFVV